MGTVSQAYIKYHEKQMQLKHPNRPRKTKATKRASCSMCKPHKKGWAPRFKRKEKAKRLDHPLNG